MKGKYGSAQKWQQEQVENTANSINDDKDGIQTDYEPLPEVPAEAKTHSRSKRDSRRHNKHQRSIYKRVHTASGRSLGAKQPYFHPKPIAKPVAVQPRSINSLDKKKGGRGVDA